jgi:Holliday junction resolvase
MNYFENKLVKLLNLYFLNKNIQAIAYRSKQSKYNLQFFDILVDSNNKLYYLAIECKSIKSLDLYFKRYFRSEQIKNLTYYQKKSGRFALLAVKFKRDMCILPWDLVLNTFENNIPKIEYSQLSKYLFTSKSLDWLDQHLYFLKYIN